MTEPTAESGRPTADGTDALAQLVRYADIASHPLVEAAGLAPETQDHVVATVLHLAEAQLSSVRADLSDRLLSSALGLLQDTEVVGHLAALPFSPDDTVAVMGDSLSADTLSWANLLQAVLKESGRTVQVINRSIAGRTTAEAIDAFTATLDLKPTWVLIMLGSNDARRHGRHTGARTTTLRESERNLRTLVEMATTEGGAHAVLLTPTPVDPIRVELSRSSGSYWQAEDIAEVAEMVKRIDPRAIDLHGIETYPDFWQSDGAHPTAQGQFAITQRVISGLAAMTTTKNLHR